MSWNTQGLDLWSRIHEEAIDVALLQEVARPTEACALEVYPPPESPWLTYGWEARPWRTAIARVSEDVELIARPTVPIVDRGSDDAGPGPGLPTSAYRSGIAVSRPGTITAADIAVDGKVEVTAVSVYAPWERPLGHDQPAWADGSAHRLLSDLTPLLWDQRRHPVIVAGDWNILHGYGEHGNLEYRDRYQGVFDRAEALGLCFVGPRHPNGRQAHPWPAELPHDSICVPTYHHSRQTPATATRQLDFVFASSVIAERVRTQALNEIDEWGPSDHCRVKIELDL